MDKHNLNNKITGDKQVLAAISQTSGNSVTSLGAESRKKSYAKHFGYKLATGLNLKKNEF